MTLALAVAGGGPVGPEVQEALRSYRELSQRQLEESVKFEQSLDRESVAVKTVEPDRVLPKIVPRLGLTARLEYFLREPSRWSEIALADLTKVKDTKFADELLWAYVRGATDGWFRVRDSNWPLLKARVAEAIAAVPGLLTEAAPHRSWWRWFAGAEVVDPHADARLRALDRFQRLLVSRDRDNQAEHMIEARFALASSATAKEFVGSYDRELDQTFLAGLNRAGAAGVMAAFDRSKTETIYVSTKAAVLEIIARHCERRGWRDLAARATELAGRTVEQREGDDPRIALHLGDTFFSAGRPDKAVAQYQRALANAGRRAPLGLEPWERVEALRGTARSQLLLAEGSPGRVRDEYREAAAENLRLGLNAGLTTSYRDDLLELYGRTLAELGYWQGAFDVYEALFTGGARREARIQGLEEAIDALLALLDDRGRPLSLRQKQIVYRRYLDLLAFYSNTPEADLGARQAPARRWEKRLRLTDDRAVEATLKTIEKRAAPPALPEGAQPSKGTPL